MSYNFYSTIYNISLLPIILGSSVLTIVNSSEINNDVMKKVNISINGVNSIMLALINSYRLNDRINSFNNSRIKFNKLNHLIESEVNKHMEKDIDKGHFENITNEYVKLFEDVPYRFPNHFRQKVIKKYGGIKKLPNNLEIDYNNIIKEDYMNNMTSDVVIKNV